ncbi:Glycosyl transferase family 2 [Geodermatophilus saharensis]|uniref:Glycosyl transferase family 2 n=1 Tax=Geodermatophilus saharensis TaxID=1137994 RepID=A0A239IAX4_9ACTN|nr:glycosyltransferase [Geodermatophilus saharensis]SNS90213.1 Glycosyl transferase family 2 [Geodermatophilus saharensis]
MTAEPLVSVVMPVRDGARYLDEAIASVLSQTLRELELVVVDDGSSDATPGILHAWQERDPRVRAHRRNEPGGVARALREGVDLAAAPYLARLDADDRAAPDRLRRQLEAFRARPALGLLGTGARYVDDAGRVFRVEVAPSGPAVARELRHGNVFFHPSVVMRRSAYDTAGGYRPQLEPAEDLDLWLRIAEHSEVDNLPEPLIDYRVHGAQSGFVALRAQATASAAALWAASVRATGAPDPAEDLERIDEALLVAHGVGVPDLRRRHLDAYSWAAETYERAGYSGIASSCWRAARVEAAALGRAEEGRLLLRRGSFRRSLGRRTAGLLDRARAAVVAPELLVPQSLRHRVGGNPAGR